MATDELPTPIVSAPSFQNVDIGIADEDDFLTYAEISQLAKKLPLTKQPNYENITISGIVF